MFLLHLVFLYSFFRLSVKPVYFDCYAVNEHSLGEELLFWELFLKKKENVSCRSLAAKSSTQSRPIQSQGSVMYAFEFRLTLKISPSL